MRQYCLIFIVGICSLICLTCGQKKKDKSFVAIIDGDTLTTQQIELVRPDSVQSAARLLRATIQIALAGRSARDGDTAQTAEFIRSLSQQLSLQCGMEWSPAAATSAFRAVSALARLNKSVSSAAQINRAVDSLFGSTVILSPALRQQPLQVPGPALLSIDSAEIGRRLTMLTVAFFALPPSCADVITAFVRDAANADLSSDISELVKGLVSDGKLKPVKTRSLTANHKDPGLALKFRPQQSIRDSIARHLPNLEALYKKSLKTHQSMEGVVWVTLNVEADGSVSSARIKQSAISQSDFLQPFMEYVKAIHFLTIPENAGSMTFDFPFEFSSQN